MPPFSILLAFSGMQQALVSTDYNLRVDECRAAAVTLLEAAGLHERPAVLRSVPVERYAAFRDRLSGAPARRAAHFFSEMERVNRGVDAFRRGDLAAFGRLMTESGESSIHNYQCGAPPLIDMYNILIETPGVYGARFSGAGFRGCCVALVAPEDAHAAAETIRRAYARKQPELSKQAGVVICQWDDGARILPPV
jgi:galactokinase